MFSLTHLRGFGLTPSAVHKRVAVGRLHRVHHGVYSLLPPTLLSREGRFLAAVLACGPGAVLSHRSAAALHELRRTDRAGIDVTVPGRTSHSHDGIDVHRSTTLLPADTVEINRIPCTTIPRTLLDLAAVVGRRSSSARSIRRRSSRLWTPAPSSLKSSAIARQPRREAPARGPRRAPRRGHGHVE